MKHQMELSLELKERLKRMKTELKKPEPLENIEWNKLLEFAESYLKEIKEKSYKDDDTERWFYETVLGIIYGKEVWQYINNILL